ncbi:MAG: hypothetical protein IPN79_13075 [Saprospiraceae bacterium]|nr:hypothetical protein [Saprospiraceae bacterium]
MKTFLSFIFIAMMVWNVRGSDTLSYYIKNQNLSEITATYIEAVICSRPLSTRYFIEIDYGQERGFLNFSDRRLAYRDGTFVEFNSTIAALNFLVGSGYEILDNQYLFDSDGDVSSRRFLMKKQTKPKDPVRY